MSATEAIRRPFPRYWLSSFLADFGDGVRLAAFPLLTLQVTGSAVAVAAVSTVQGLPWLIGGLGVGALVDRWDLRRTMVVVDVARTALVIALAVAVAGHVVTLPLIYLTAFTTGVGSMIRDTASTTAVPRLVHDDGLNKANGRLIAGSIVGNELAGPAVGGWLFGVAATLPFALNAGSLGIAMLLLLTLPSVFAPLPRAPGSAGILRGGLRDVREGLGWLRDDRPMRILMVSVGIVAAADGAYLAVLVLYVTRVLHQNAAIYGLLLAVGALGGIAAGTIGDRLVRPLGSRGTLAVTMIVMAGTQLLLALTASMVAAGLALAGSSAAFALFNAVCATMRQRRTPPWLLGRINSTYLTIGRSAEALGALAGGTLAILAGIRAPILVGVLPLLATTALVLRLPKESPGLHGTSGQPV